MFAEKGKPAGTRAAMRGIWYFMRTVIWVSALLFLCYGVFITAMNATNLFIIATEGLELRAECVLQDGPTDHLPLYFTENFLSRDAVLGSGKYEDYTINSYDYRIQVESISAWPWMSSANMVITERMASMNGSILEDKKQENATEGTEYPLPEWQSGRYRLHFSKRNDRWFIYQMQLLEASPSEEPLRTPNMSLTPMPAYTTPPPATTTTPQATPRPTPTPSPTQGGATSTEVPEGESVERAEE